MYLGFLDCPIGAWIQAYSAWHQPSLTGPLMRLLLASWQQDPCGTLPAADVQLAHMAGVSEDDFRSVKGALLQGFVAAGERWSCPQLVERATQLAQQHGESLARMYSSAVGAVMSPEVFSLHSDALEVAGQATRARRRQLPPGFTVAVSVMAWAQAHFKRKVVSQGGNGEPDEREVREAMTQMLELFKRDAISHSRLYADWDRAFMSFVDRQTNGEFGACVRFFPERFPVTVMPAPTLHPPLGGRFSYGKPFNRAAALAESADQALQAALAASEAGPVFDINEPLRAR